MSFPNFNIDGEEYELTNSKYSLYIENENRDIRREAFNTLYETYKRNSEMSEFTDFRVAYYASMHEAAMRLKGGLIMPLWEDLNNARLKKEMKKLKKKMRFNEHR